MIYYEIFNQNFIVENKIGATGNIAAGFVGSSSSEKIQSASASTSGNALSSGGSTQYDKDQTTKTNIIIGCVNQCPNGVLNHQMLVHLL